MRVIGPACLSACLPTNYTALQPYLALVQPGDPVWGAGVVQHEAGQVDGGPRVDVQVTAAENHRAGL